jgi:uncharacterized protein
MTTGSIYKKIVFQVIEIFLLCYSAIAQEIPDPMFPYRMVNDFSGLLNPDDAQKLESKLQSFYNETSTQIYVVIVDDLGGYAISDFAYQVGEKWGVGTKGKNNGIVILLNPSADRTHGEAFVATGYGLEGAVPDAVANRLVDLEMVPYFKEQKFYEGLDAAINIIIDLTKGEYTADKYLASKEETSPFIEILLPLIFLIIFLSIFGARKSRYYSAGRNNIPFWLAMFLLSGSKNSHNGSFKNFKTGGGGFGGFGGGGFGGGGGGHFGGGGAGGRW